MRLPTPALCLLFFLVSSLLLHRPTFASKRSYVVYLGAHSHPPNFSELELNQVTDTHCEFLGSFLGSHELAKESIFYSYTRHINGFAATLEEEHASQIAQHPKVISIFLNKGRQLHTTRSWGFMGLAHSGGTPATNSTWEKARYGEDTIIGNLDTGAWPESKSFSEEGYGPIPSKWKGICQNDKDPGFHCNRKLIGARYFSKGLSAEVAPLNSSYQTPRDSDGHGTHTLSTAGGNFVAGASVFGYGNGTASGGSPKARVATYKVCWTPVNESLCYDADILAAFDVAISDGVDVLSVSLGGDVRPFFEDSIAIGSFHAITNGIPVICSAGNDGPDDATVSNIAPWQIIVAASTMDREFPSYVRLGDGKQFKGQSLSAAALAIKQFYPLLSAADAKVANSSAKEAVLCKAGTLDPEKAKGKILVCLRGDNSRMEKSEQAQKAGAAGMILVNDESTGNEIIADPHVLPVSHINYTDGNFVLAYINSTQTPSAYIELPTTIFGTKPAPYMAAFSSKGPNTLTPDILKPDITAPGVSIIAAYTEAEEPTNQVFDGRTIPFNSESGTSMSCPHISGIVGLLKTLYPQWSPAAIRSAIMTTAYTKDNAGEKVLNASYSEATAFNYGAGHVEPNRAINPGLVYDLDTNDYLNVLCALGYNATQIEQFSKDPYKCPTPAISLTNLNYPSITVSKLSGSLVVKRTLKNVGDAGTYSARIVNPNGIMISVNPNSMEFKQAGEEKSFELTMEAKQTSKDYVFGELMWSDGTHYVRSPIVVKTA